MLASKIFCIYDGNHHRFSPFVFFFWTRNKISIFILNFEITASLGVEKTMIETAILGLNIIRHEI